MTHPSTRLTDGVSRRNFLEATGALGIAGLSGCTAQQANGGAGEPTSTDDGINAADSESNSLSGEINIAGSSTVFPLATRMAELFLEDHSAVGINVQSTGSGGGFQNHFCPGHTDFNNASRPITPEEENFCASNGVEPIELTVATDALTVIVNTDADFIDCITTDELAEIWSGDAPPTQWSAVNADWPDEEFQLFGPTEASGTFDYFLEAIIGEDGTHRQDHQATEQDRTIIQGVQGSEYAMGYLGFAYYSENTDAVKALAVDAGDGCVTPSLETAKSGEYTPLARPLFTYPAQSALAESHIAEFARFWVEHLTSTEIVANDVGYVPLDQQQQSVQMEKLEAAITDA